MFVNNLCFVFLLHVFTSHRYLTSPVVLLLLHWSFFLRDATILLQRPDGALTDYRLPPKLPIVDHFDDDRRHVELFCWKSLQRKEEFKKRKVTE